MLVSWLTLRLATAEPMAPKAALEGAKMVTSDNPLTVETKLAVVRAEARDVRPAAIAVAESEAGMVRTVINDVDNSIGEFDVLQQALVLRK